MNRLYKAHFALMLTGWKRLIIILISQALLTTGAILVIFSIHYGWLVISLSIYPMILIFYYHGELKNLKINPEDKTFTGWVEMEVLGKLSSNPTPLDFANALRGTAGERFMSIRFGIPLDALTGLASNEHDDLEAFWSEIVDVMHITNSPQACAEVIATAIIKTSAQSDLLLKPMLLDIEDLYAGIRWLAHIKQLASETNTPRKTGGIARDWSFGWTPTLSKYGVNLSLDTSFALPTVDLPSRDQALEQMFSVLGSSTKRNVAILGSTGVGKTALLQDFGNELMNGSSKHKSSPLIYHQLFLLDASALVASAKNKGDLESLLNQIFVEAYAAKNIIVGFDNAHLFFEDGTGSVDASNVLKSLLENGSLPMILVFNDQKYSSLIARDPDLSNMMNRLTIQPSGEDETLIIMQDAILPIEASREVTFMYQALKEAYTAGLRYVRDSAMPAQAVILLEAAASHSKNGLVTAQSVRNAVESQFGIKMGVADEKKEKDTLLNLESLIHERMINQDSAVAAVSDALRRARAGVRNEKRPIGTYLFIGPTGVGKTELAKSLASVYFGGEERMVRIDLNEYVTEQDVIRLIADASSNPASLTAQVLRSPFSVVLLDEIEKAHPKVLSTLLQVLDEGILKDEKNKEVSFRDAIIIATSNAGASRIKEYVARGLDVVKLKKQFIDELISAGDFTPEFLNRFDEIVMFTPLSESDLLKVVDIILASINQNLAKQKIQVQLDDTAKKFIVENGNDPVFGARPIKRIIQKVVENIVARDVLSGKINPGETIQITVEDMVTAIK